VRRLVTAASLLVLVLGAALLTAASGDGGGGETYRIVFDNAFGLTEGGDFKIAGVRAGQTTKFKVSSERPRKAVVEVKITEPGVGKLTDNASCDIKPQSLIGEYFVDCQPGNARPLPPGGTLSVEHTSSTIPIDLVNNILRRPYRERLRLIISELGTGLAGRPQDLAEVLRRAHPGLRETSRTLRILARQDQVIRKFIGDAATVVSALNDRRADVARWVDEAGNTAAITATRRAALQRNFQLLPRTLAELRPYMVRLGELADAQVPLLTELQRAAPDLNTTLKRLGPFSNNARPAFRALGRASKKGTAAIKASDEEIAQLRSLGQTAPAVAKPLRQFLQTMDDRNRAVETDARAKATAPPAPDKTAIPGSGGFTGFEALWDYFYWQALSINGSDLNSGPGGNVGHVLRIAGLINGCQDYWANNAGAQSTFDKCNQWLGPNQPGITTPDETPSAAKKSAQRRSARSIRTNAITPARPGSAAPTPAPSSRPGRGPVGDLVRELTSPTGLPRLLPRLPRTPRPRGSGSSGDSLLDFLLAP
jgi:phospholipid/cholesterol/gamma-HCH transport system substrate-binding protein